MPHRRVDDTSRTAILTATAIGASGEVDVTRCKGNAPVGEGAKWSADRATAWRMSDGKAGETISLEDAARIAERVGLPVPGKSS